MQQATQQKQAVNLTRDVSFLFDFMVVASDMKVTESIENKLLGAGKTLVNAASKMMKF